MVPDVGVSDVSLFGVAASPALGDGSAVFVPAPFGVADDDEEDEEDGDDVGSDDTDVVGLGDAAFPAAPAAGTPMPSMEMAAITAAMDLSPWRGDVPKSLLMTRGMHGEYPFRRPDPLFVFFTINPAIPSSFHATGATMLALRPASAMIWPQTSRHHLNYPLFTTSR